MRDRVLIIGYDSQMIDYFLGLNYHVDSVLDYYDVIDGMDEIKDNERRFFVDDAADSAQVVNKLMEILPLDASYSSVITRYEGTMTTAAVVKELFSFPREISLGNCIYRNKAFQKNVIKEFLSVAEFKVLRTFESVENFEFEYPVVCKPKNGQGTVNTIKINNREELIKEINSFWNKKTIEILVEKLIEGEEYHVDGWICKGQLQKFLISKYNEPVLNVVNTARLSSVQVECCSFMYNEVEEILRELIQELSIVSGVFHMEFFKNKQGELIFSELAMRPGGGKIVNIFELKTGINLIDVLCSLEQGNDFYNKFDVDDKQVYGFSFLPFPKKKVDLENLKTDLITTFKEIVTVDIEWLDNEYPKVINNSYTRFGQIVVRSSTSNSLAKIIKKILEYYDRRY